MCRACRQDLILRAVHPSAKQAPHFRHQNSQDCPATAARRRQVERDDQVVIELRDQLVQAWPGVPITLELPFEQEDSTQASGLPPAIVVHGQAGTVVVERPRTVPAPEQVRARISAVRAQHGQRVRHVWFLAKDPGQFARCGTLRVAPRGRPRADHITVAPTEQQLAIAAGGGGVYWLDGRQVLVPYGVHDFTHERRDGEAWDFPDWRRGWRRDWRISQPYPAPEATRWGLVPTSLHQLTATKATFDLAEVHEVMQRLEQVQQARWRRRRSDARELYSSRQVSAVSPRSTAGSLRPAVKGTAGGGEASTPPAGSSASSGSLESASVPRLATPPSIVPARPSHPPATIPPPPRTPPSPAALPEEVQRRRGLRGVLGRLLRRR